MPYAEIQGQREQDARNGPGSAPPLRPSARCFPNGGPGAYRPRLEQPQLKQQPQSQQKHQHQPLQKHQHQHQPQQKHQHQHQPQQKHQHQPQQRQQQQQNFGSGILQQPQNFGLGILQKPENFGSGILQQPQNFYRNKSRNRNRNRNRNRSEQQLKHNYYSYQQQKEEPGLQNRKPHLFVKYTDLSIRRVFVAAEDPGVSGATSLLKLEPVPKTSLAHLSGEAMYTLALCHTPEEMRERCAELYTQVYRANDRPSQTAKPLSAREVAYSVIDRLYEDMSQAMDCVRSYLESRFWIGVKPKLWLRFGRMLFHSRQNSCNVAEHKPFSVDGLENLLHGPKYEDSVLKTFDADISHIFFRKIRSLVGADGLEAPVSKEKFIIHIADATQARNSLICTCRRSLTADGPRLTLCKIRTEPLRHMVADFACMEQDLDLRLILTTRQEFKGDMSTLQTIVDKAIYDVKAEGGLSWPLGSTSSGPYTVTGATHLMQTNLKSQGCKWKLKQANRTALNASAARYSFEVDVTSNQWGDQFKVWKDLYEKGEIMDGTRHGDHFVKPLSTLFSWVWSNCI